MKKYIVILFLLLNSLSAHADCALATSLLTKKMDAMEDKNHNYFPFILLHGLPNKKYTHRQTIVRREQTQKEIQQWLFISMNTIDAVSPVVLPSIWLIDNTP